MTFLNSLLDVATVIGVVYIGGFVAIYVFDLLITLLVEKFK